MFHLNSFGKREFDGIFFLKNGYFGIYWNTFFNRPIGTFYIPNLKIIKPKLFFVVLRMAGIEKVTFDMPHSVFVCFFDFVTVKTWCVGTGIDFNLNSKQIQFLKISDVLSTDNFFIQTHNYISKVSRKTFSQLINKSSNQQCRSL